MREKRNRFRGGGISRENSGRNLEGLDRASGKTPPTRTGTARNALYGFFYRGSEYIQ